MPKSKPQNTNCSFSEDFFKDSVYLVTGASGGLGRAIAIELAANGATVVLSGRSVANLEKTYDLIEDKGYPEPAIIPFDLEQTNSKKFQELINSIYNEFKGLDGIINAACEVGIMSPIRDQDDDFWLKTQQVNLNACFLLSKVATPLLTQSDTASITFISDSSARQGKAYWGAYGVSKIALEGLSATLADELDSTSIKCNVFIPGPSQLPVRKKTHPGEESSQQLDINSVSDALLGLIASRKTGQIFSAQ